MSTLETILDTFDDFDGIGQTAVISSAKYLNLRGHRAKDNEPIALIKLEGYTEGLPIGAYVDFTVNIEVGDTMPPDEIVARVMNRHDPDYVYGGDDDGAH
jgi:hypothetical protein